MNKKFLYLAVCILTVFAFVFTTCGQPTGGSNYNYTVTFDKNHNDPDGFTEANPPTMTVSSPATTLGSLPTAPTRNGYTFAEWEDGEGTEFTQYTRVTRDITVYAQWDTEGSDFTINLSMDGNVEGDSVDVSPSSGKAGETVTISYTVANGGSSHNQLAFSGLSPAIDPVTSHGSGTREYAINGEDAVNGKITINAVFNHSNLMNDIIAFTGAQENKTYGDGTFTKTITTTGAGSGAVSYSSGNDAVAMVNNSGLVSIVGVGDSVITATKAKDGEYLGTTATYLLKVAQKQLSMSGQTVTTTRAYTAGSTTAAVTAGTMNGKVGNDAVSVSTAATYNSAYVAEADLITVVYTMSGADAGKYIKPADYTIEGSITKANGTAMSGSTSLTAATTTPTSVTLNTIGLTGGSTVQTVEYARNTTSTAPSTGYQDDKTFNDLTPNMRYYFFARSKENANYKAGTSKASAAITTQKTTFTVALNITGKADGDSVTLSSSSGEAGANLTINYTVANASDNNRLAFSGVNSAIAPVNAVGNGTRTYTINENDAVGTTITINAAFTHTNLQLNTITFANSHENKTYGDAAFTNTLNQGSGTGILSFSSSDTDVATVNGSGLVTILKDGNTTITATKGSDGNYAAATATYNLTVTKKQLTMSGQTVTATRPYNGNTTANVTAGTVNGKVGTDDVSISTAAAYNSANVADANLITVVYTMSGTDAGKYLKPIDYTLEGTITKAVGIAISGSTNLTAATITQTSVTLNTIGLTDNSTVQTVEYARNTTNSAPTSGWQDGTAFNNLTSNTTYYFFARSKSNSNYNAGTGTAVKASGAIKTASTVLNVAITRSGNVSGDSATISPTSGSPGDTVTISYTLARTGTAKNELSFSGVGAAITSVSASGTGTAQSGTRTYTINEVDAANGTITINAVFNHTNLVNDIIAFTGATESKTYGDAVFTKALTNTGSGTGAITWSSGTSSVATVNSSNGAVTIANVGTTVITATKAADANYTVATASYTLTVAQKQLTISTTTNTTVTTTKTYDGNTTAAVTRAGNLSGIVDGDNVTVTAAANYNSADAGTGKTITVVYTIAGASVSKYLEPVNYTTIGIINKASGSALTANPTAATTASTSITLNAATLSDATGQSIEYAQNTSTTTPTSGWKEDRTFTGLTANTQYYFHARSKENTNYNAGTARNAQLRTATAGTPSAPSIKIDFEADNVGKTYSSTKGGSAGTMAVVADPTASSQKSLKVTASGYNQAPIIPVNLTYALENYATLSFRINISSGTDLGNKKLMAYAASDASAFKDHGFGNPADSTYPQFAANLAGETTPAVDFASNTYKDKWTTFTINLSPGSTIGGLKGNIFIAFGFNSENAVYLIDDLVFTPKPDFVPPAPPPSTALNPPSIGAVTSGTYRNMFKEFGKTDAEITAKVNTTFNKLFNGTADQKIYYEVTVSGENMAYILDSGAESGGQPSPDVRSEGMSYGMMMAVQMNDQNKFDKLWRWAKKYMYNETNRGKNSRGYFAWQVKPNGDVLDYGPAPDGEFYFATALLFAHARWGSASGATNVLNYRQRAMQLLYDMIHRDTAKGDNHNEPPMFRIDGSGQYMTTFQPQGNAATFTDPSYHLPAFYEVWAIEMEKDADANNLYGIWSNAAAMRTDATFYRDAAATSRKFFPKTTHSTTGLGPDYAAFDGSPTGNQPYFAYDAFRIAMNVAMDYAWFAADSWQKTFADRIQSFFENQGVTTYKALWEINGTARGGDHSPGLVACNAVASLAATNARAWLFLDDFWNIGMTEGRYRYYDGCLYMLGLLHVTGNFKAYLSGSGTYTPSSNIEPSSAIFDKRDDLQADIVINMTLNGNTLSNIKNGSTTLTSGSSANYTLGSGDTVVTLRKEYLATLPIGTATLTFNFSAGSARELGITVKQTPIGGTPSGGTSFDFSTLTSVTTSYVGSTISASITGGALKVVKTASGHSNEGVILTFDLGSQTLGSFTGVKLTYRGVSGDTGYKDFIIEVPNTAGGTFNALGSNTKLTVTQQVNGTTQTTYNKINFAGTAPTTRTGEIQILVGMAGNAMSYDIILIELVP